MRPSFWTNDQRSNSGRLASLRSTVDLPSATVVCVKDQPRGGSERNSFIAASSSGGTAAMAEPQSASRTRNERIRATNRKAGVESIRNVNFTRRRQVPMSIPNRQLGGAAEIETMKVEPDVYIELRNHRPARLHFEHSTRRTIWIVITRYLLRSPPRPTRRCCLGSRKIRESRRARRGS